MLHTNPLVLCRCLPLILVHISSLHLLVSHYNNNESIENKCIKWYVVSSSTLPCVAQRR